MSEEDFITRTEIFGRNIRTYRRKLEMSIAQLADQAGMTAMTLTKVGLGQTQALAIDFLEYHEYWTWNWKNSSSIQTFKRGKYPDEAHS